MYIDRVDMGERRFSFRIAPGVGFAEIPALAQQFNETPFALSLSPTGTGVNKNLWKISIDKKEIILCACKLDDKNRVIMRLFNSGAGHVTANVSAGGVFGVLAFNQYEVKTIIVGQNELIENDMMII